MRIKTSSQAIDFLGGTTKVARMFGVLPSAVSNWRKTGFPARMHYRIARELERRGVNPKRVIEGVAA